MNYISHYSKDKSQGYWLQILNILFLLVTIGVNTAAIFLPLNGRTTKEISDEDPNLFVPAGFTFSIWSVIYLVQLISFLSILWKSYKGNSFYKELTSRVGILFLITCICNCCWLISWHYGELLLSLLFMITLLATLIYIYSRLHQYSGELLFHKWDVMAQYSIYLGWISVATISNIAAILVHYYWMGWGLTTLSWAMLMLIVAFVLAIYFLISKRDSLFAFTITWALYGISNKETAAIKYVDEIRIFASWLFLILLILSFADLVYRIIRRMPAKPI